MLLVNVLVFSFFVLLLNSNTVFYCSVAGRYFSVLYSRRNGVQSGLFLPFAPAPEPPSSDQGGEVVRDGWKKKEAEYGLGLSQESNESEGDSEHG